MGHYSELTHKALLPVGNKAVISRIIEQFPQQTHFVIAVGYRKQYIIDYLKIAHSDLNYSIIEVKNFDGPGSGPGLSLFSCKAELQEPFLYTSCDTLIQEPIDLTDKRNWIGVQEVEDVSPWCSVIVENDMVARLIYKQEVDTNLIFTGIAFVVDYEKFWDGLADNRELLANELQVNNGLNALIPCGLEINHLKWVDAGNEENYVSLLESYDKNYTFLGKTTDCTYRIGDQVIKFFRDEDISVRRYNRAKANNGIFADIIDSVGSFYSYRYQPGKLLSGSINYVNCMKFLVWVSENLWAQSVDKHKLSRSTIERFYLNKTLERLDFFLSKYGSLIPYDNIAINGMEIPGIEAAIRSIQPLLADNALPSAYHGDLHSDNVIVCEDGYRLIDWRDSFGDSVDVGDRYYDLAKFYHTLEFSVASMDKGAFKYSVDGRSVFIEHSCNYSELDASTAFWDFVASEGYSKKQIELINALIYLNMSSLYHKDLACYLYYLGVYSLQKALLDSYV